MMTGEYMHTATAFLNAEVGSMRWLDALKRLVAFAVSGDTNAAAARALIADTLNVKITTDAPPKAANDSAILMPGAIEATQ
jgi:hypothetical protein